MRCIVCIKVDRPQRLQRPVSEQAGQDQADRDQAHVQIGKRLCHGIAVGEIPVVVIAGGEGLVTPIGPAGGWKPVHLGPAFVEKDGRIGPLFRHPSRKRHGAADRRAAVGSAVVGLGRRLVLDEVLGVDQQRVDAPLGKALTGLDAGGHAGKAPIRARRQLVGELPAEGIFAAQGQLAAIGPGQPLQPPWHRGAGRAGGMVDQRIAPDIGPHGADLLRGGCTAERREDQADRPRETLDHGRTSRCVSVPVIEQTPMAIVRPVASQWRGICARRKPRARFLTFR